MPEDLTSTIKQLDLQIERVKAEYEALLATKDILLTRQRFTSANHDLPGDRPLSLSSSDTERSVAAVENLSKRVSKGSPNKNIIPDDLKLEQYRGQGLSEVLEIVCRDVTGSFTVDDLIPKIYKTATDEEFKACRGSLNAALSRAVAARLLERTGRGVFTLREEGTGDTEPLLDLRSDLDSEVNHYG